MGVNCLLFSTEIIFDKNTLSLLALSSASSETQGNKEYLRACVCILNEVKDKIKIKIVKGIHVRLPSNVDIQQK